MRKNAKQIRGRFGVFWAIIIPHSTQNFLFENFNSNKKNIIWTFTVTMNSSSGRRQLYRWRPTTNWYDTLSPTDRYLLFPIQNYIVVTLVYLKWYIVVFILFFYFGNSSKLQFIDEITSDINAAFGVFFILYRSDLDRIRRLSRFRFVWYKCPRAPRNWHSVF